MSYLTYASEFRLSDWGPPDPIKTPEDYDEFWEEVDQEKEAMIYDPEWLFYASENEIDNLEEDYFFSHHIEKSIHDKWTNRRCNDFVS